VSTGNQQLLQRYAQPLFVSSATDDVNVPFSYKDWYAAHQGIVPGQEFKQYNEYLVRWYKERREVVEDFKLQLRLNYLTLLKQLQLFFTQEEAENWYSKVNLDSDKELLLAIPYFAKKLKDISLYYLQLRTAIKESRLRYNQTGTNTGIIEQIQKFLLTNYTKKPNTSISLPGSIWKNVPELSAIRDNIAIQIEELYDAQNYSDRTSTLPPSAYYITDSVELERFLSTKGLTLTSTEWIYRLGVNALSADYTDTVGQDLIEISNKIAQKYIGQDKFTSFSAIPSTQIDFFNIDINEGNNFFYWPEGVYRTKAKQQQRYQLVNINESGLTTVATPGSSLDIADTIFIQTTRGIQGAWFRNNLYDYKKEDMEAVINFNDKTVFRFPFPGYGLSAEDINWTGFSTKFDPTFFFLDDSIQKSIENEYWSTSIELSAVSPIKINDTTLVNSKAFANIDFTRADKIDVWFEVPNYDQPVFNGESKSAWLYRFNKTDISIGTGENVIVWPYEKINPEDDFPDYYPTNISEICLPIPVSALNVPYSVAGNNLSSADTIYKLTNYQDLLEDAIECCWLSGSGYINSNEKLITTNQNSFQLLVDSGKYVKFVWLGRDGIDANNVFKTISHQPDCDYINTPNYSYINFNNCTCKQTNFTPFGHPGDKLTDNIGFADFIIEDNFTPEQLDLSTWRDSNGNNYTTSPSFAWYKTNEVPGWGYGRWFSGDDNIDNKLFLQKGKKYVYYRAKVKTLDTTEVILPSYVIRFTDPEFTNTEIWIKAFKNENNEWVSSNEPSQMILTPGDIINYTRTNITNFTLTGTVLEEVDISENRGSIWSDLDYVSNNTGKTVTVIFPDVGVPGINITTLSAVTQWTLTPPSGPVQIYRNTPGFTFIPSLTGIYSISVQALTAAVIPGSIPASITINNIPGITAISAIQALPSLTSFDIPITGYVWNTSLQGWDYNLGIKSLYALPTNQGAIPFWAKTYTEKNEFTGFGGIQAWGTPQRIVDEYNILTQPEISDIVLNIGNKIEYTRNYPVDLTWIQPINFQVTINKNEWCTLEFETTASSNLSYQLNNFKTELTVRPTTNISNLSIPTLVDNEPTEVYYNAINSFTWSITAVPEIETTIFSQPSANLIIEANQPWANISNQFYPSIAAFPAIDELYSSIDVGGFFNPSNLGISTYIDKDYVVNLDVSSSALSGYFEDVKKRVNGRGFTKQDQPTPYTKIKENNIWLKEPTVAGPIAGTIKKSIFKKYQKFLPYQSGYETNPRLQVGMLTPKSRQSPWGGFENSEWIDKANFPQSPTGEINVQAWADSQILKQTGLQVDVWCTDIFGNQYGLYKQLSGTDPYSKKFTPGEIWVRKNSQFTSPASVALKDVFDTYANTNLVNELTGKGIRKIDMFFDTLLVETSGAIIFEKLIYDFNTDNIFSLTDEARYLSLAMPVSANLNKEFANTNLTNTVFAQAGETWFFPEEKFVTQSVCGVRNFILVPELYRLNLNNQNFRRIFPTLSEDITTTRQLSSLNIVSVEPPVLSHNSLKKEYLLTILGKNTANRNVVIEFKIKDLTIPFLENITVYEPLPPNLQLDPPYIDQQLITDLQITNIEFENALNFQCIAENGPVIFEPVNMPSWINLSSNGLFTGTPPFETTQYNALFKVTNSAGPTFYNFQINVTYTPILTIYYLYTEGYDVDGFLVQEEHDGNNIISRIIE
jgi:hypothetical protein